MLCCHTVAGTQRRRPRIQLVMQLCQLDLADMLETRGRLTSDDTSYVIKQILEGLVYLHSNNVIHRYVETIVSFHLINLNNLHIADYLIN